MDKDKYTYEELLDIVKTLRSEEGCPWDREQTHQTLKPCMLEEAAEVVSAIRIYDQTGDDENLIEELGDVLLQVVMHSEIAEEEGRFTIEDVVHGIAAKMKRRHPHVFAGLDVSGTAQVLDNWEEIKKKEKEMSLNEIPREFPALIRAPKVLKRVDKLYDNRKSYEESIRDLAAATEALQALQPESYSMEISEKIGDALLAISNVSQLCKLSQEQILIDRIEDIIDTYE